jgi:uncharacterized protein YgbK (DUF1537 family)
MSGTIGAIADDFTGGTDAAVAFRRAGLRTLIYFGIPPESERPPAYDAVVVALKSRMAPSADAVAESRTALRWLRARGAQHIYSKFCSTFDSTAQGNIGPVLDALSDDLAAGPVLLTPSSPEHRRTQYQGYLLVDDLLLSESHMRHHPVTPMTDSSLPRLLRAQTDRPVSLLPHAVVRAGEAPVRAALARAGAAGSRYVLADAIDDADLATLGRATVATPLTAGAAGLAGGLAAAFTERRGGEPFPDSDVASGRMGRAAVISGSCSARTLEQVEWMRALGRPVHRLDPTVDSDPARLATTALTWFDGLPAGEAPLIYSSCSPAELRGIQDALGVRRSAEILEAATGRITTGLVERGVTRLVTAGGETAGAVVRALGVGGARIGAEAARGVPWIYPTTGPAVALLLKSGNFGEPDLLADASSAGREG